MVNRKKPMTVSGRAQGGGRRKETTGVFEGDVKIDFLMTRIMTRPKYRI